MTYIENVNTRKQDTGDIDAFGRTRVSQLNTQVDIKQIQDEQPLFIDVVTNATGSHTYNGSTSSSTLATAASGDYAIAQTLQRFNYRSGKSQLIFMTMNNFEVETNITKRIGYFSSETTGDFTGKLDGLFLESDTDVSINVYRQGTVVESVSQTSWNLDDLQGGGGASNPSGINIDWSLGQILIIDFEWLGVGRVRWGVVVDGMIVYFHETLNANSTTDVYMKSPNQPLRWEVRQDGAGSGSMDYICATVAVEGDIDRIGKIFSENLDTAHVNANSTANKYALLGIRLQSSKLDTLVDIIDYTVLSETNDNQLIEVWLNPTVAGTFTYNAVTDSACEVAKGASGGSNTVSGGTLIYSQYINLQDATSLEIDNAIRLGATIDGTQDEIVISTNPLTSNSDVLASINWRELT